MHAHPPESLFTRIFNPLSVTILLGIAVGSTIARLMPLSSVPDVLQITHPQARILLGTVLSLVCTVWFFALMSDYADADENEDLEPTLYTRLLTSWGSKLEAALQEFTPYTALVGVTLLLNPVWHLFGLGLPSWPFVTLLSIILLVAVASVLCRVLGAMLLDKFIASQDPN